MVHLTLEVRIPRQSIRLSSCPPTQPSLSCLAWPVSREIRRDVCARIPLSCQEIFMLKHARTGTLRIPDKNEDEGMNLRLEVLRSLSRPAETRAELQRVEGILMERVECQNSISPAPVLNWDRAVQHPSRTSQNMKHWGFEARTQSQARRKILLAKLANGPPAQRLHTPRTLHDAPTWGLSSSDAIDSYYTRTIKTKTVQSS